MGKAVKGSGKFLGIGQVAASTTNNLRSRCAASCVLAADVAVLLLHAVRTAECARLGPSRSVRSAERGIWRGPVVSVQSPAAPSCLGMNKEPAGLSVLVCRPRDRTAGCLGECLNRAVMVKGKVVPIHAIKAYGGSRRIAPLILNLGTRCECLTSRLCHITPVKEPLCPLNRRLVWHQNTEFRKMGGAS